MFTSLKQIRPTFIRFLFILVIIVLLPQPANAESDLPAKAYISGVSGRPQAYQLSCESRSAVDWAGYLGVEISEKKFLNHLPRSDNPDQGFVGNPNDPLGNIPPRSYGVHAGPVAALLREYGIPAQAQINAPWQSIQAEIAAGQPVIVWVIGQMWNGSPIQYTSTDGERTTVARYEHTMILVGYSPKFVFAIDAATGQESAYSLKAFLNSWGVLGQMAITLQNPEPGGDGVVETEVVVPTIEIPMDEIITPTPTPIGDPVGDQAQTSVGPVRDTQRIYTVRRGDYLTGIARKYGVNWRKLARINNLAAPYILYTGQKLRIP